MCERDPNLFVEGTVRVINIDVEPRVMNLHVTVMLGNDTELELS